MQNKIISMRILFALFISCVFASCSPRITYLGDSYSANPRPVDVFYDELDIRGKFRVMGLITANSSRSINKSMNHIRDAMIEDARERGADGILFVDFYSLDFEDINTVINAKLLRYE